MMSDEVIAEVRAVKDAIGATFNYDIRALFEEIKRGEAQLQAKGINVVAPPEDAATLPSSALRRTRFARR